MASRPKNQSWWHAVGVAEELGSLEYSLRKMVYHVLAPLIGLVCLYGLGGVVIHGRADTIIGINGSRYVTPDQPIAYLLTILATGVPLLIALFVFFHEDAEQ